MTVFQLIQCSGLTGLGIILATFVLLVVGIILLTDAKRRKSMKLFLCLSFIPLLFGLLGTYLGNREFDRVMRGIPEARPQEIEDADHMLRFSTKMGIVGSAPLILIAIAGLMLKKEEQQED